MSSAPGRPLVSVVTATYNRSNVLQWAIKSVLWQTYDNWELWVIGDACTDDTEEVVRSFPDPRVRFYNLPENVGEQSGPNNEGCRRSAGKYIAFLNHDDLWFPDHLERTVEVLESTNAVLAYPLVDRIFGDGTRAPNGVFPGRSYGPGPLVPASCWVFRRSLLEEVGPWRHFREIDNVPSQDWLYRAWRSGKKMHVVPHLTVMSLGSTTRPGCYANRDEEEQKYFFEQIKDDPDFRATSGPGAEMPTAS